tara:strand:+ start:45 stop:248 length:204 start_codon:yes stop_codon:yes gene_type:complete
MQVGDLVKVRSPYEHAGRQGVVINKIKGSRSFIKNNGFDFFFSVRFPDTGEVANLTATAMEVVSEAR